MCGDNANMKKNFRIAVITPYYDENPSILAKCISSVSEQTKNCDHFMIADGLPQSWINDVQNIRHLVLDKPHGNNGNTPRGLGSYIAKCEGYDAITFLDADNWYEKNHIEHCLEVLENNDKKIDCIIGRRIIRGFDGTILEKHVPEPGHIDTSEFFLLKSAFHLLPYWINMPNEFGPICDRIFSFIVFKKKLKLAYTEKPTVNFLMRYAGVYKSEGLVVPSEANHKIHWERIRSWFYDLSEEKRNEIEHNLSLEPNTLIL